MGWRLRILARNISHLWVTELSTVDSGPLLSTGVANDASTRARIAADGRASSETWLARNTKRRASDNQGRRRIPVPSRANLTVSYVRAHIPR